MSAAETSKPTSSHIRLVGILQTGGRVAVTGLQQGALFNQVQALRNGGATTRGTLETSQALHFRSKTLSLRLLLAARLTFSIVVYLVTVSSLLSRDTPI
jgi:hypothetical protein